MVWAVQAQRRLPADGTTRAYKCAKTDSLVPGAKPRELNFPKQSIIVEIENCIVYYRMKALAATVQCAGGLAHIPVCCTIIREMRTPYVCESLGNGTEPAPENNKLRAV